MYWGEEGEPEDVGYFMGHDLVFAVDILSPHKLVTQDGRALFYGGWTELPLEQSYGVLIAAGEPVNEFTMDIIQQSGISLPLPVSYFRREPIIHEGKYL